MQQIKRVTFTAPLPGSRVLVFGAIHGDEVCGPTAIHRCMEELSRGQLTLARGSVTFVPVCNHEAFERRVRFVDENLNRVFRVTDRPQSREARIANELCGLMAQGYDFFLDIHSTSAAGPVAVFLDYPTESNCAFAAALGAPYTLLGWPEVYKRAETHTPSFDTLRHAHGLGITSALIECGQHQDKNSADIAYTTIHRALMHAGVLNATEYGNSPSRRIRMLRLVMKDAEGDVYAKPWRHLERVARSEALALRANGTRELAEQDLVMVLPKAHAQAGEEWYYVGVEEV